jgi:hypothetical protein
MYHIKEGSFAGGREQEAALLGAKRKNLEGKTFASAFY